MNFLLDNLKDNSVDMQPSFDNRRIEPCVLPSKLPLILVNGSFGIGGGFMSSIPSHKLENIVSATKLVINNPKIPVKELIDKSKLYPCYPTGGIIINKKEVIDAYCDFKSSKTKSIKIRSKIIEDEKNHRLIIKEIPYMKSLETIKKSILTIVNDKDNKNLQGIKNIIDASEKGNIDLIIQVNKEYDLSVVKNQLYKYTACQTSIPLSAVLVKNDELILYNNIKDIISDWISFRKETIKRIKRNSIKNIEYRIHILEGLIKVLKDKNIDILIKIVRNGKSRQEIIETIMKTFELTEVQSTYIAEMKLYNLNKFEINKLIEERDDLKEKLNNEIEFLKNEKKLNNYICNELDDSLKSRYIDRLHFESENIDDSNEINTEDIIADENFILILTKNGYLKKIQNNIRSQKRNGMGISIGNIKENDIPTKIINANSRDNILLFTTTGKVFMYKCYEIETSSLKSYGKMISSLVKNEKIVTILSLSNEELNNKNLHIVSSSKLGKIKMTCIKEFQRLNSSGIIYSKVADNDEIISVNAEDITKEFSILSVNSSGNAINISSNDIPIVARTTFGSNIFDSSEIKKGITIINSVVINKDTDGILIITENAFGKRINISEFPIQKRAGKGRIAVKFKDKSDNVSVVSSYTKENLENQLIIMATKSIININLKDINISLRPAYGTSVKKLAKDEKIIDACIF